MELNEQDKERIVAEEKLRMETRKEFFKENFGGMHGWHGRWGGGWHGNGCHGYRCGGGFFKALILVAVLFGLCHLWHHTACGYPGYYGYPSPAPQSAPAPQPSVKN